MEKGEIQTSTRKGMAPTQILKFYSYQAGARNRWKLKFSYHSHYKS